MSLTNRLCIQLSSPPSWQKYSKVNDLNDHDSTKADQCHNKEKNITGIRSSFKSKFCELNQRKKEEISKIKKGNVKVRFKKKRLHFESKVDP